MQRQIEPPPIAARPRSAPVSRYWFQRNRRWLGDVGTIVLLLLVLFPFVWLVQMSFRPNKDILGYELLFDADARALQGALDRRIPGFVRQQHDHQRLLDGAGAA